MRRWQPWTDQERMDAELGRKRLDARTPEQWFEHIEKLEALLRRAAPFVNAVVVLAEDKTPGLAWLADAEAALPGQILSDPADDVVPDDALEEKWRREPADAAGWERRATRTLNLARMWKRNAEEWERMARQEAS